MSVPVIEAAPGPRVRRHSAKALDATEVVRARAPLRLGLAGGGTDVSPYCDLYGGCVLNSTINLFSYATIETAPEGTVEFVAPDLGVSVRLDAGETLALEEPLRLHRAVYNRIVRDFTDGRPPSLRMTTFSDAPPGSGLGTSSTLMVAMLRGMMEWLGVRLCEYDLGHLAYEVERIDAGLGGGKQDQYAAAFGGFNFMEFYADDRAVINQLRVREAIISEFESSLVLFDTGRSRHSAEIIAEQSSNVADPSASRAIEAMHGIREDAFAIKESLLKGDMAALTDVFRQSWERKKRTAQSISNPQIDHVYDRVMGAGGLAGKVSGAGGGGFMMFIVDPVRRQSVLEVLSQEKGRIVPFHFVGNGALAWRIRGHGLVR